jgi:hypothetical protein
MTIIKNGVDHMDQEVIILDGIYVTPLIKAHQQLKQGLAQAKTELEQDGAIL